MFLDILELRIENKKNVEGKLFENVVSEIHKIELVLSLLADKDYECFYGF